MSGFGQKGVGAAVEARIRREAGELPQPLRYDVTPHPLKMLLGIVLFGACALVLAAKLGDPRGLLINGLIELSPAGADVFFALVALGSLAMTVFAAIGLFRSFGEKVYVTSDDQAIAGPLSYNGTRLTRIGFGAIREVKVRRVRDQELLVVVAVDERKIKVGKGNFRVASEWAAFMAELGKRLGT